jgi:uncharacterized protein (TIGR03067 family)
MTALILVAADDKDEVKKEFERFQGTWAFESVTVEGEAAPAESLKGAKLVIKGDKFTAHEGKEVLHGTFTVDPGKNPKTLDVTFSDGPDKGKTMHGIYELTGDTYKVCIGMPGKERPKEFASKKGSGHVLEVLKREKK